LNYSVAPGVVLRLNFRAVNALEYFRWRQQEHGFPAGAPSKPGPGICQLRLTRAINQKVSMLLDCLGAPHARQCRFKP
jgi:hypothetical protein